MSDFWSRLDTVRAENDVLAHPFYVRWTRGELTRKELAGYAGQYRHAVAAIADAAERAAELAPAEDAPGLARHAEEEADHVELWDRFANAVGGASDAETIPETAACVDAWTSDDLGLLGHLVTLYAIEAAQPAIAEVKRDGLVRFYGIDPGAGTEYFDVHAERDHEHAAEGRELIAARLQGVDEGALVERARETLAANLRLLDGVERLNAYG